MLGGPPIISSGTPPQSAIHVNSHLPATAASSSIEPVAASGHSAPLRYAIANPAMNSLLPTSVHGGGGNFSAQQPAQQMPNNMPFSYSNIPPPGRY